MDGCIAIIRIAQLKSKGDIKQISMHLVTCTQLKEFFGHVSKKTKNKKMKSRRSHSGKLSTWIRCSFSHSSTFQGIRVQLRNAAPRSASLLIKTPMTCWRNSLMVMTGKLPPWSKMVKCPPLRTEGRAPITFKAYNWAALLAILGVDSTRAILGGDCSSQNGQPTGKCSLYSSDCIRIDCWEKKAFTSRSNQIVQWIISHANHGRFWSLTFWWCHILTCVCFDSS